MRHAVTSTAASLGRTKDDFATDGPLRLPLDGVMSRCTWQPSQSPLDVRRGQLYIWTKGKQKKIIQQRSLNLRHNPVDEVVVTGTSIN